MKKANLSTLLLSCLFFIFLIDSGGPLGLRPFSLVIVFILASIFLLKKFNKYFISNVNVSKDICIFILLFYFFIFYGVFSSILNDIELSTIALWLTPISCFIIFLFCFLLFESKVLIRSYILSGYFFSGVFLCLFLLSLILSKNEAESVFLILKNFPGWFYIRENGYPNIYFQATLTLVPIALLAYFEGYKKSYYFFLIILILCLSRFGVFTIFIFTLFSLPLKKLENRYYAFILVISLVLPSILFICFLGLYVTNVGSYVNLGTGFDVRLGHLISVFNIDMLGKFLLGSGAGSYYYSLGFDKYVDNIEVSHLELLRKYGIFGYYIFHISIVYLMAYLIKKREKQLILLFLSFYLVALSNPILLTFSLSILVALIISITIKREKHERKNNVYNGYI